MAFIWFYPKRISGPTFTSDSAVVMAAEKNRCVTYECAFNRYSIFNFVKQRTIGLPTFLRTHVLTRLVATVLISAAISLIVSLLFIQICQPPVLNLISVFFVCSLPFFFWIYSVYPVCKISVYFLRSGEPFPIIERADSICPQEHIFAVRLLSWNANSRYNPSDESFSRKYRYENISFEMGGRSENKKKKSLFESDVLSDYWSLLYFSLENQLRAMEGARTGETYRIAGLLNRNSVFIYFLLLSIVFFLVQIPEYIRDPIYSDQLSIVFGVLVLTWAFSSVSAYRKKIFALTQWEAECKRRPFLNCPIFRATPSPTKGVVWLELDPSEFKNPIKEFGVNIEVVVKVVVAVKVMIFLTMLQLIK